MVKSLPLLGDGSLYKGREGVMGSAPVWLPLCTIYIHGGFYLRKRKKNTVIRDTKAFP